MELESEFETESRKLKTIGDKRINDPEDWVEDYNIDSFITFILDENDPAYNEEDDNVLVQIRETGYTSWENPGDFTTNSDVNFSEYANMEGHPMQNEHHCWLFHDLYDHHDLDWRNILRIGHIHLDSCINFQDWDTFSV